MNSLREEFPSTKILLSQLDEPINLNQMYEDDLLLDDINLKDHEKFVLQMKKVIKVI